MQISAKNTNKNLTETGLPCQGMESIDEEININSNLKTIQKRADKNSAIFTNYTNLYKSRLAPDSGRDGSMESIDEHCKNFAMSSWTQFKVVLIIIIQIPAPQFLVI